MRLMRFLLLLMLSMVVPHNFLFASESNATNLEIVLPGSKRLQAVTAKDERTKRIIFQASLVRSGQKFLEEKKFEQAIAKFEAAVEIDKELYGNEFGGGYAGTARVYEEQGKYERALEHVSNLLKDRPKQESFVDWKMKLEAFIQAENEGTNQPIYNHINFYQKKYKNDLPPKKYWFQSTFYASQIIQLYDHVGDAKGGTFFINQILSYPKLGDKARNEYLKVQEAFEQDKVQNSKGRATQVLIQSDYFPW